MPFTHETETQFQKSQLGVESTWGTGVAATIALGSVTINPSWKKDSRNFASRGYLLPTVFVRGKEHTELSFEGESTFAEIGYFVKDVVSDAQAAPTAYTVEAGGLQVAGCVVTGWTLKGTRDAIALSGSMIGKAASVAAPTGALTPAAQVPLPATGVVIKFANTTLTKWFEWEVSVSDMWGGAAFGGDTTFQNVLQKAINGTFKLKWEANSTNMAFMDDTDTKTVTITITSGAKSVTLVFDIQVGEPSSYSDEEGIYAIELNGQIMNKATKAISVTVVDS